MKLKNCYACRKSLPLNADFFALNASKKDGYDNRCKKCVSRYQKKHFQENKVRLVSKTRHYRDSNIKKGKCCFCVEARLPNSKSFCEKHFLERVSMTNLGTTKHGIDLKSAFEKQGGKCAYTGESLVLGLNASLDHIKPLHTHPELSKDVSNVHWVLRQVNEMKRHHSEMEFLTLVSKIAMYRAESTLEECVV
jgi:hypothetical protein